MKSEELKSLVNKFIELTPEELETCITLNDYSQLIVDYTRICAFKQFKFEYVFNHLRTSLADDLEKDGIPKSFTNKKIKIALIDWLQNYVDAFKEKLLTTEVDREEVIVEQMFCNNLKDLIIGWDENS